MPLYGYAPTPKATQNKALSFLLKNFSFKFLFFFQNFFLILLCYVICLCSCCDCFMFYTFERLYIVYGCCFAYRCLDIVLKCFAIRFRICIIMYFVCIILVFLGLNSRRFLFVYY